MKVCSDILIESKLLLGIVDNSNHDHFRIDFAETKDTDTIKVSFLNLQKKATAYVKTAVLL